MTAYTNIVEALLAAVRRGHYARHANVPRLSRDAGAPKAEVRRHIANLYAVGCSRSDTDWHAVAMAMAMQLDIDIESIGREMRAQRSTP